MSNPFREAMEALVNEKVGAAANRTVAGIVISVNEANDSCKVCPVDVDTIWDVKNYYSKTKVDRFAVQGVIDKVALVSQEGLKVGVVVRGDRVVVAYQEDRPYILQKVSQANGMNITSKSRQITLNGKERSVYDWVGQDSMGAYADGFGANPLPGASAAGDVQ
jgi:hypothetical protein